MTEVPRRTVRELLCLHQLEESLKDVFVEGDYDVAVVLQFLRDIGCETVVVRKIDCIAIDDSSLRRDGRDVGNRERVIYLAEQIEASPEVDGKVLCIADRDWGDWIGDLPELRDLAFTDHSCMESYVWSASSLRKFLTVYCNRPDWSAEQVLGVLQPPLQSMFAIRLATRSLGMSVVWLKGVVCVELDSWSMSFNVREFLKRLLNKNSALDELDRVELRVAHFRAQFCQDPRKSIHAHDLMRLLAYLLNRKGVSVVKIETTAISRAMAICLGTSELREEPLFQRVAEFASGTS